MAKKMSPFAALTSEQKQIKWMEYQSIRLPYTEAITVSEEEQVPDTTEKNISQPSPAAPAVHPGTERPTVSPPREVFVQDRSAGISPLLAQQQKSRHHQYDAVIARMKQAELLAGSYYHCSDQTKKQNTAVPD